MPHSPLRRISPRTIGSVDKGKSRPYVTLGRTTNRTAAGQTAGHGVRYPSSGQSNHNTSSELTFAGINDHYAGYITLGRDEQGPTLRGGLLYHDLNLNRRHNRHSRYGYGFGHGRRSFGYHYSDHHYGLDHGPHYGFHIEYDPFRRTFFHNPYHYGYTYASVYYPYRSIYYRACDDVDVDVHVYTADEAEEHRADVYTNNHAASGYRTVVEPLSAPLPPSTAPPADLPNARLLASEGNIAFASGRFSEARSLYTQAMLVDERDGYVKFLYAVAHFAAGDFDAAGPALRRALLIAPTLIEYPVDVRALYASPFRWEVHLKGLAGYIASNPEDVDARILQGFLLYATGEPQRGLTALIFVTASNPADDLAAVLYDAVLIAKQDRPLTR